MAFQSRLIPDTRRLGEAIRRLASQGISAPALSEAELREAEAELRHLRARLSEAEARLRHEADRRTPADNGVPRTEQCDWAWRPDLFRHAVEPHGHVAPASGTALGKGTALFHDATAPELTFRQAENARADHPRFGVAIEVYRFDGSFLSLVFDLPQAAVTGLTLGHYVALDLVLDTEAPLELFGRLNVQHGPNTEQLVREMPVSDGRAVAEFDLAYSRINERRIERAWLDLILEAPRMNRVCLRDLTMIRAPRAEM